MADGTLIFDTAIDLDGIERALKGLQEATGAAFGGTFEAAQSDVEKLQGALERAAPAAKELKQSFDYDGASAKELTERQEELKGAIDRCRSQLSQFHDEQLKLDALYQRGEIDKGKFNELREKVNSTEKALRENEQALLDTTVALARHGGEADDAAGAVNRLSDRSGTAADKSGKLADQSKKAAGGIQKMGDHASGSASKVGTLTIAMGNLVARGIEKALSAFKDFLKVGIEYSSGLEEVQNVVDVTFGPARAQMVNHWAQTSAEAFGLTELQAKEFTGTIGSMLSAMGMTKSKTFDMSVAITELAGDMASFKNVKPEEALDKLRAGLSGETEPLRAWGIMVNESTVKAYAYKNGIASAGQELTENQKVLARYGLIMEQTSDIQGDFSRTSGSYANQLRVAENNVKKAASAIGEKLLPVLTDGLKEFNMFIENNGEVLSHWGTIIATVANIILSIISLVVRIPPEILIIVLAIVKLLVLWDKFTKAVSAGGGVLTLLGKQFQMANVTFTQFAIVVVAVVGALALLLFLMVALSDGTDEANHAAQRYQQTLTQTQRATAQGQKNITGHAIGTLSAPRGTAWVGERGAELVEFTGGERVYTATQSAALAASQGGGGTVSVVNYNRIDAGNIAQVERLIALLNGERLSMRMGYAGR